jgi:hypothetical protein
MVILFTLKRCLVINFESKDINRWNSCRNSIDFIVFIQASFSWHFPPKVAALVPDLIVDYYSIKLHCLKYK